LTPFITNPFRFGGSTFDTSGIKIYFHFEESSGNIINQATTGAGFADGLGSNSDGVSSGDPTYSQTGKIDNAIAYDGSGDFFTLGSTKSDFKFLTDDTNFTIAFWAKRSTAASTIQGTFGNGEGGSTNGMGIRYFGSGTQYMLRIENGTGNASKNKATTNYVPDNTTTWYHYIITLDKDSGGVWNIYRDNANNETNTEDLAWSASDPTNLPTVAHDGQSGGINPLNGLIDELVVFTRIITADEREYLYNSGNGQIIA